jgi:hypothetical protein
MSLRKRFMYYPLLEDVLFIATCFGSIEPSSGYIYIYIYMIVRKLLYLRHTLFCSYNIVLAVKFRLLLRCTWYIIPDFRSIRFFQLLLKTTVYWEMTPCRLVELYLHLQQSELCLLHSSNPKMEAIRSYGISTNFYQITMCHIARDGTLSSLYLLLNGKVKVTLRLTIRQNVEV